MSLWLVTIGVDICGVLLRLVLSLSSVGDILMDRPEINTPVNSLQRMRECIALHEFGQSPYDGELCHQDPLLILAMQFLLSLPQSMLTLLYSIIDVACAHLLASASYNYVFLVLAEQKRVVVNSKGVVKSSLLVNKGSASKVHMLVHFCYMLNPYSIGCSVCLTVTSLHNLALAVVLYCSVIGQWFPAIMALSTFALHSYYPLVFIAPIIMFTKGGHMYSVEWVCRCVMQVLLLALLCFLWTYAGAQAISQPNVEQVLDATLGFVLRAPELNANCGLFWYFFTSMFDHFNTFFLWVFQVNVLLYVVPLMICLRRDPFLLYVELLLLTAVFKSYPCVGDAAIFLCLLPAFGHLFDHIRHGLIVAVTLLICSVLAPVMWTLWIHSGSANANFYFAISLLYSTCHIFILTDLLSAYLRREVHLKFANEPLIDGKPAKIKLR